MSAMKARELAKTCRWLEGHIAGAAYRGETSTTAKLPNDQAHCIAEHLKGFGYSVLIKQAEDGFDRELSISWEEAE